uniref:SVOP like n=1 Tax=Malurus cyaneus samueli TaxID=2593467 RepID=A0A8C5UGS3_9PASS
MASAAKEAENAIGLEEIHAEMKEPPKGQKTFTVEEAVETIGFGRFHIMLYLIMGSIGVVETMEIMLIAVVSPLIRCEWQLQDWQVALVTTMVFFGYMVFSIALELLADRYGHWKILLLSFLWAAYFSLLTSFAPSYIWFVFLRAMVGGGVLGHAQGVEILPTSLSGLQVHSGQLHIKNLQSYKYIKNKYKKLEIFRHGLLLCFQLIPESARYNVSMGKVQAALATLQRISSMNGVPTPQGQLREPPKVSPGCGTAQPIHSKQVVCFVLGFFLLNLCLLRKMLALGMGTSGSLCCAGAMVAPFISQVLRSASFLGTLRLFSSMCILCAISAVTLPIETKGRALQVVKRMENQKSVELFVYSEKCPLHLKSNI